MFARYKVARTQYQSPIWSQDVLACTQIEENQTRRGSHQSEIFSNVKASEKWCRPFLTKVIIIAQKCPKLSAIINCIVRTTIDSASLDNKYFLISLVNFHQHFGYCIDCFDQWLAKIMFASTMWHSFVTLYYLIYYDRMRYSAIARPQRGLWLSPPPPFGQLTFLLWRRRCETRISLHCKNTMYVHFLRQNEAICYIVSSV